MVYSHCFVNMEYPAAAPETLHNLSIIKEILSVFQG